MVDRNKNPILIETFCLLNGKFMHKPYHNRRFNQSREELFGIKQHFDLDNVLDIPDEKKKGLFLCRITYAKEILKIEFEPYTPRVIRTLKLVPFHELDYSYKFADRSGLASLFNQRESADDIIIVKNGLLTDTSIANIALLKKGLWYTPHKPLLAGTTRARLLSENILEEAAIRTEDIFDYEKIRIMNAMVDFSLPINIDTILK